MPELEVDLPATAIGKDYLGSAMVAAAPSGSGVQLSLGGVLGVAVSGVDGLEFNVLGLNFGISPNGLKLPLMGRVGSGSSPSHAGCSPHDGQACRFHDANSLHSAVVKGVSKLRGAEVEVPDVRAGFSSVIAAAIADGPSVLRGIHHLERGYHRPAQQFVELGLQLEVH